MKRLIGILLAVAMVCCLLPVAAFAEEMTASGICGEGVSWTLGSDGVLTISGEGTMDDYEENETPWEPWRGEIKAVDVGAGVVYVGNYAFGNCENLKEVTFRSSKPAFGINILYNNTLFVYYPDNDETWDSIVYRPLGGNDVSWISYGGCEHEFVAEVYEPGCEWVGQTYFECALCEEYYYGDYVEPLGHLFLDENWFVEEEATCTRDSASGNECARGCGSMAYEIHEGTALGHTYEDGRCIRCGIGEDGNFDSRYCGRDLTWTLEDGVLTISGTGPMFDFDSGWEEDDRVAPWPQEGVEAIVICDGVTYIGNYAFSSNSAAAVSIADSVTSIGEEAFSYCEEMTEVKLPENLAAAGSNAFLRSGLTSVTIPGSLRELGEGMFTYCHKLRSVVMEDGVEVISSGAFRGCSGLKEVTIPDSVTTIEEYAFAECFDFREITIPASVTYIGDMALYCEMGDMFGLNVIRFCGNAPELGRNVFQFVRAICYYPANDATWEPIISDPEISYDCVLQWVPYEVGSTFVPGDMGGDGIVDADDVAQLLWHILFPTEYGISGPGDINDDGIIDDRDVAYLLWHTLFPKDYPL